MATSPYLPDTDAGKDAFLTNFALKLPAYQTALQLSAGDVTAVQNAAALFHWARVTQEQTATSAKQWTAFKNRLRDGAVVAPIVLPVDPVIGAAPALPAPGYGIFKWIGQLVQRIKNSPAYTDAIGQDLGIIGAEQTFDPEAAKPVLTLRLVAGGQPEIGWKKGPFTALEIEVNRGTGFAFLAIDTEPDYVDTFTPPATPTIWTYRAVYRLGESMAGQWSDPAEITVGG
ncbi:MAG TPA: hypothetical protein VIM61_12220 [Chthoniobacterales bacterium]